MRCDSVKCFNNSVEMVLSNVESEEGKYNVYVCPVCNNKRYVAVPGIEVSSVNTDEEQYETATYERIASERLQDYMEEKGYDEDQEDEAYDELLENIESEINPGDDEFDSVRSVVISEAIDDFIERVDDVIAQREEDEDEEDEEEPEEED